MKEKHFDIHVLFLSDFVFILSYLFLEGRILQTILIKQISSHLFFSQTYRNLSKMFEIFKYKCFKNFIYFSPRNFLRSKFLFFFATNVATLILNNLRVYIRKINNKEGNKSWFLFYLDNCKLIFSIFMNHEFAAVELFPAHVLSRLKRHVYSVRPTWWWN